LPEGTALPGRLQILVVTQIARVSTAEQSPQNVPPKPPTYYCLIVYLVLGRLDRIEVSVKCSYSVQDSVRSDW